MLRQLAGSVVVDASVAVEYLVGLSLTGHAQALFHTLLERDGEMWAPDLVYPECLAAFRRLVRLRSIDAASATRAVDDLLRLPLAIASTRELSGRAWGLRESVTPYDACYAVLAQVLEAPLVTADRRLARTLAGLGTIAVFLGDID
jgi:predicted nucleic acid-binding protein